MKSPWTPALDKELMALSAQGLSFREIAQRMGMTRNAVLGRSQRLRGIVYPSTILAWKANNERRRKGPRKPEPGRRAAIAEMAANLRRGMPRGEAMARASAAALWLDIGNYFGITRQGAQLAVKTWRERAGKPKKRPGRPRKSKSTGKSTTSTTSTKSIRP
jgi:GcrA cell cycle regulator